MDTRTSPARLRIERIREALRGARLRRGRWCRRATRTCPNTCPSAGRARQWASGFTGSMATLVVTPERAALFADSRYWVQAERELAGSGIELVRRSPTPAGDAAHRLAVRERRARRARSPSTATCSASAAARQLRDDARALRHRAAQRPRRRSPPPGPTGRRLPAAPVYEHRAPRSAARRAPSKLGQVRAAMRDAGATHHFVSTVDDIAWLLNLRGADVGYNPVFLAHLLVDADARDALRRRRQDRRGARAPRSPPTASRVAPYDDAGAALAALPAGARAAASTRSASTLGLRERVPRRRVVEAINPSTLAKSRKSDAEAAHVRRAMIEDGAAMCEFYAWFEAALADPARRDADHRADDRREARRGARAAPRLRRPELRDDRRLQRQRRDAALPRDARVARDRSKATACC